MEQVASGMKYQECRNTDGAGGFTHAGKGFRHAGSQGEQVASSMKERVSGV